MKQEMKNRRVESLGQATLNSYNFKSLRNRFDDADLYNKAESQDQVHIILNLINLKLKKQLELF